jgi:hypothetical protein
MNTPTLEAMNAKHERFRAALKTDSALRALIDAWNARATLRAEITSLRGLIDAKQERVARMTADISRKAAEVQPENVEHLP